MAIAISGAVLGPWAVSPLGPARAATATATRPLDAVLGFLASAPRPRPPAPGRAEPPEVPTTAVPDLAASPPMSPRCAAARRVVEGGGLTLPAAFEFRCPGSTEMYPGDRQHWGITCSHASLCPAGAYVAVNPDRIGPSDARLHYVVAHEICHALDVVAGRRLDEGAADACAARHGFPRV